MSNDPDHLRRAAKIYEGMAMIHESMGQKLQVLLQPSFLGARLRAYACMCTYTHVNIQEMYIYAVCMCVHVYAREGGGRGRWAGD